MPCFCAVAKDPSQWPTPVPMTEAPKKIPSFANCRTSTSTLPHSQTKTYNGDRGSHALALSSFVRLQYGLLAFTDSLLSIQPSTHEEYPSPPPRPQTWPPAPPRAPSPSSTRPPPSASSPSAPAARPPDSTNAAARYTPPRCAQSRARPARSSGTARRTSRRRSL